MGGAKKKPTARKNAMVNSAAQKKPAPKTVAKLAAVQPKKRAVSQRVVSPKRRRMQQLNERDRSSSSSSSSNSDRTSSSGRSRSPYSDRSSFIDRSRTPLGLETRFDQGQPGCSFNKCDCESRQMDASDSIHLLKEVKDGVKEIKNFLTQLFDDNQSFNLANKVGGNTLKNFLRPVEEQGIHENFGAFDDSWERLDEFNPTVIAPLDDLDNKAMVEQETTYEADRNWEETRDQFEAGEARNMPTFAHEEKKTETSLSVMTSPPHSYFGHLPAYGK